VRGTSQPPPIHNNANIASSATHTQKGDGKRKNKERKLTAFEIARSVDALPRVRVVAVHTACHPAVSLLSAGATTEPAPFGAAGALRGTRAAGNALAVADLRGLLAYALGRVVRREGRESVDALEGAFG
jgi:hypothetical protein